MKVIDLLNKIANGEEVPKKIKVGNSAFELSLVELNGRKHYLGNTESVLNNVLGMGQLNDEVKIIEENKEIGKLKVKYGLNEYEINDFYAGRATYEIAVKINEIIDKINKMEDK